MRMLAAVLLASCAGSEDGLPAEVPASWKEHRLASGHVAHLEKDVRCKDVIERAIKKSQGGDAENYDEVRYEGFGPGGVAIIVEALTDNRNRTAADIRAAFSKYGGAMGETGSVSFQFERKGVLRYPASVGNADAMLEAAIEAGAEDVESGEDGHEVST